MLQINRNCRKNIHIKRGNIMLTNIAVDDNLMAEAMKFSNMEAKNAVVEKGLHLLIQLKKQERIKSLRGKLIWDSDLNRMRVDR